MLRTYEARHTWCRHDRLDLPIRPAFECGAVKLRTKSIVWSYFKISEDERIQYIEFCKQILIDIAILGMCALLISVNSALVDLGECSMSTDG